MHIIDILWLPNIVEKLEAKHNVQPYEVEEVFIGGPSFRRIERGKVQGEDLSTVGQTDAGRYLIVYSFANRAVLPWSSALVTWTRENADNMDANKPIDPIPEEFEDIEAAAEFWDTHSLADYWDDTEEVHFDVDLQRSVFLVPLEHNLARRLADVARRQGLSAETLVNLWVSDHLQQVAG